MRVAIVVRSGPASGRRILLKAGQVARFGRSNWADFAFTDDAAMAEVHFEIRCEAQACHIAALAKDSPTLVNQQPVTSARLNSGDIIVAGHTHLVLDIQGAGQTALDIQAVTAAEETPDVEATFKLSEYFGLSEPAIELAKAHPQPESFERLLSDQQRWEDAVRWRAHRLPKPQAVAWLLACIEAEKAQGPMAELDPKDCQVAVGWAQDPSEDNRRQAAEQLESNGGSGLGGMLTAAVAWSGGSLAPEGLDVVPPEERLTAHCVATALSILSHTAKSPGPAADRLKRYLQTSQ